MYFWPQLSNLWWNGMPNLVRLSDHLTTELVGFRITCYWNLSDNYCLFSGQGPKPFSFWVWVFNSTWIGDFFLNPTQVTASPLQGEALAEAKSGRRPPVLQRGQQMDLSLQRHRSLSEWGSVSVGLLSAAGPGIPEGPRTHVEKRACPGMVTQFHSLCYLLRFKNSWQSCRVKAKWFFIRLTDNDLAFKLRVQNSKET